MESRKTTYDTDARIGVGYQALANAIIKKACQDYLSALAGKGEKAQWEREKLEFFFRSDLYKSYCTIDGSYLIRELKKKHAGKEEEKRRREEAKKNRKKYKKRVKMSQSEPK